MTEQLKPADKKVETDREVTIIGVKVKTGADLDNLPSIDDAAEYTHGKNAEGQDVLWRVAGYGATPDGTRVKIIDKGNLDFDLLPAPLPKEPEYTTENIGEVSNSEPVRRNLGQRMLGRLFKNNEEAHWVGNSGALAPNSDPNSDVQRMTIIDHTGKEPQKTIIVNNYDLNHQ